LGLGLSYLQGLGVKADPVRADSLLQDAESKLAFFTAMGAGAYQAMGSTSISSYYPAPDAQKKLIAQMRERAEGGESQAQYDLGLAYLAGGQGVKLDNALAAHWFGLAAGQDLLAAQYNLAQLTLRGWGVTKDLHQAAELFLKASDKGSVRGSFAAGYMLAEAIGVTEDVERGVTLLNKAAAAGNADAQSILAVWYARGHHVTRDVNVAKQWWARRMGCEHFPELQPLN